MTYALTDVDLDATLKTFAAHACVGTILILDMVNAAAFLPGGACPTRRTMSINTSQFSATAELEYTFDRRRQLFMRKRVWTFADGSTEVDYCKYRMLFPAELEYRLKKERFRVLDMYDNKDRRSTDLSSGILYVSARYEGESR